MAEDGPPIVGAFSLHEEGKPGIGDLAARYPARARTSLTIGDSSRSHVKSQEVGTQSNIMPIIMLN
jgi:hypothetical protein